MSIKNLVIASLVVMLFASSMSLMSPGYTAPSSTPRMLSKISNDNIVDRRPDRRGDHDLARVSGVISYAVSYSQYEQIIETARHRIATTRNSEQDAFLNTADLLSDIERLITWTRVDNTAPFQKLGALAGELITLSEAKLQAKGLELMLLMPPQRKHAPVVLEVLDGHHDVRVYALGIAELARHRDFSAEVDALMLRTLEAGSRFSSHAVTTHIDQLVTSSNVSAYESVLARLPKDSHKALRLKAGLEQFHNASAD